MNRYTKGSYLASSVQPSPHKKRSFLDPMWITFVGENEREIKKGKENNGGKSGPLTLLSVHSLNSD